VIELTAGAYDRTFSVMSVRALVSTLLIAWATQAMPALCVAGVLSHACECTERAGCDHSSDCEHESGCTHESDCASDPCDEAVPRVQRQADPVVEASVFILLPMFVPQGAEPIFASSRAKSADSGGGTPPFPLHPGAPGFSLLI